jgi:hypothetical protein
MLLLRSTGLILRGGLSGGGGADQESSEGWSDGGRVVSAG